MMTGRAFRLSLLLFVLSAVGDTVTTIYGVGVTGLTETNPTVAAFIASHGLLMLLPVTVIVIGVIGTGAVVVARLPVPYSEFVATGLLAYGTALKTVATVWNLLLIV